MNIQTATGLAVALFGLALAVLSRIQLGSSFSVVPKATSLVTHGIYSRFQHPMYLFIDIFVMGAAAAAHSWYIVLPLAIMIPLQVVNCRREGKLLDERFGERYRAYRRATWF